MKDIIDLLHKTLCLVFGHKQCNCMARGYSTGRWYNYLHCSRCGMVKVAGRVIQ